MTNEERIRELLKNAEKFDGLSFIKERIANREQIRKEKREKLKELMEREAAEAEMDKYNRMEEDSEMDNYREIEDE